MTSDTNIRWVFDRVPASGARRGGEAAQHVFKHSVDTFVREVVQNANDQALNAAEIRFGYQVLEGDPLSRFLRAMGWDTLVPHLQNAADTGRAEGLDEALEQIRSGRLAVLTVHDYGTVGLTGGESEDDGHFSALCRDILFSQKQDQAAGGSFGLGKSVLWLFSSVSTVLFLSVLSNHGSGQASPRLIGRAELPSHQLADQGWHSGSGWFGSVAQKERGERAESVWGDQAAEIGRALGLTRSLEETGTSISVIGFRDPTREKAQSGPTLRKQLREAVLLNFWPALSRGDQLSVGWQEAEAVHYFDVAASGSISPFLETLDRDPVEVLEMPGDVVETEIPVSIPALRDHEGSGDPVEGTIRLRVRLGGPSDPGAYRDHVALFRGPGMVVKYWRRSRLAVGARPFFAVAMCGVARDPDDVTESDEAVEHFLRAAEPPGHDDWDSTPRLRARYKRGYKKAIDTMMADITDAIRRLVTPVPAEGRRGPDRLRKRFPLGGRSSIATGRGESPFRFADLGAHFDGARWIVFGHIEPTASHSGWTARLRINQVQEDGKRARHGIVPLRVLEVDTDHAHCLIEDGVGRIHAAPDVNLVEFMLQTDSESADSWSGEIELELMGELS